MIIIVVLGQLQQKKLNFFFKEFNNSSQTSHRMTSIIELWDGKFVVFMLKCSKKKEEKSHSNTCKHTNSNFDLV
jgi:hypothetical protein